MLSGRLAVELPISSINLENMQDCLDKIREVHTSNSVDIDILYDYYRGIQEILDKVKTVRTDINNITVENHAFEIVEFLKGYMVGRPIKYSQINAGELTDDIGMLNKYMLDQSKNSKDNDLWTWLSICGVGYYLCLPTNKVIDNIDKQAPFSLYQLDPRTCGVIYSSFIGREKIGGYLITDKDKKTKILTIYAPNKIFTMETDSSLKEITSLVEERQSILPYIPIIEYKLNMAKIGIIEVVKDMLDTLNFITSNQEDDIQQFVNNLLVFKNANVTKELLEQMEEMKIIKLLDANPTVHSDISLLQQSLNHSDIETLYNRTYNRMMGIIAIPKSSDRASSGGDTGQARLLGEGWTLADQRAMNYQNSTSISERELLNIILYICRNNPSCKINALYTSDIEIKYSRSKSDNMLVKSQVILNLKTAGFPEEIITQTSELFDADLEVANAWKKNLEKQKQETQAEETKKLEVEKTEVEEEEVVVNNQDNRTKSLNE